MLVMLLTALFLMLEHPLRQFVTAFIASNEDL